MPPLALSRATWRYIHSWLTGQLIMSPTPLVCSGLQSATSINANKVDGIRRDSTLLTRQPSCRGKLVSLLRLIGLPAQLRQKLTTDSRWMNPELFGNAGL